MVGPGRVAQSPGMVVSCPFVLAEATPSELPAAALLLRETLGFEPADGVPAWLMQTVSGRGGVCLVARDGRRVVGASFALPVLDADGPSLFSCGLAVAVTHRGRGIGRALKEKQREEARALGLTAIRWTADPLNARALRLYLNGLGAELVAYHQALYDQSRRGARTPQDDVLFRWDIARTREPVAAVMPAGTVPVPWEAERLEHHEWLAWRHRVRDLVSGLLGSGLVGTRVVSQPERRRDLLEFRPAHDG
jgi:predicted GNAT superfamily acetyltransferase